MASTLNLFLEATQFLLFSVFRKSRKNSLFYQIHLTKLSLELKQPWTIFFFLPLALMSLRTTPCSPSFISPFEFMFVHPFFLGSASVSPIPLSDYFPTLSLMRHLLLEHADNTTTTPVSTACLSPSFQGLGVSQECSSFSFIPQMDRTVPSCVDYPNSIQECRKTFLVLSQQG